MKFLSSLSSPLSYFSFFMQHPKNHDSNTRYARHSLPLFYLLCTNIPRFWIDDHVWNVRSPFHLFLAYYFFEIYTPLIITTTIFISTISIIPEYQQTDYVWKLKLKEHRWSLLSKLQLNHIWYLPFVRRWSLYLFSCTKENTDTQRRTS